MESDFLPLCFQHLLLTYRSGYIIKVSVKVTAKQAFFARLLYYLCSLVQYIMTGVQKEPKLIFNQEKKVHKHAPRCPFYNGILADHLKVIIWKSATITQTHSNWYCPFERAGMVLKKKKKKKDQSGDPSFCQQITKQGTAAYDFNLWLPTTLL